jgi:hypothetical protein
VENLECDPWILVENESVVLVGEEYFCQRVYDYLQQAVRKPRCIKYCDILKNAEADTAMPGCLPEEIQKEDICLVMFPD